MIAENIKIWEEQLRDEGRIEGEQKGRIEGEQKGLREAVKVALEFKFAAAGIAFWNEHFEARNIAAWGDILNVVKAAENLTALRKFGK